MCATNARLVFFSCLLTLIFASGSRSRSRSHALIRQPNLAQYSQLVKAAVYKKALPRLSEVQSSNPNVLGSNAQQYKRELLEGFEVIKNALERGADTSTGVTLKQNDACEEINQVQTILYLSGCYEPFEVESRSDFASVLQDSCATCNLTEAYELALNLPASCTENNYGNSGIDYVFPFLFAFCSVDDDGGLCAESLAEMTMFDFGEDSDNTPLFNAEAIVEGCSGATCVEAFWDAWSDHPLDQDACPADLIDMSLLCVQSGDSYCVNAGEGLFTDKDSFLASQSAVEAFCGNSCGRAILTQYDTEYTAKEDCYNSYTTNIADKLCLVREDGQFCTVEVTAVIVGQDDATSASACPSGPPSTWQSCDESCVDEISTMNERLGCCAREYPAMMYGEDEGDTLVELCQVTLPAACSLAQYPTDDTSSPTTPSSTSDGFACFPAIVVVFGLPLLPFVHESFFHAPW